MGNSIEVHCNDLHFVGKVARFLQSMTRQDEGIVVSEGKVVRLRIPSASMEDYASLGKKVYERYADRCRIRYN